ncbi:hypothetical protein THAOC_26768 [Thalassiosira oceanica]|uniref:J domain-containing protein n=1 Tax=Thalassiosira oceanica TaxID=159749 RepID=K0RY39_THAOC|nr:hypothetical protein THAOC_26768 [Thalassiosira oceanica]|eukprot:EJK53731.1 hypothetical protein THAOC_26768 [Thalassiosira oceanica]
MTMVKFFHVLSFLTTTAVKGQEQLLSNNETDIPTEDADAVDEQSTPICADDEELFRLQLISGPGENDSWIESSPTRHQHHQHQKRRSTPSALGARTTSPALMSNYAYQRISVTPLQWGGTLVARTAAAVIEAVTPTSLQVLTLAMGARTTRDATMGKPNLNSSSIGFSSSGRPQLHNKDTLVSNLQLMFERIEYVNIDATGRLQDWIKYAQDASVWKELIQCMLDPQRELPARPNWGSRDSSNRGANSQSNSSSQRQEQSGPRQERAGRRPPPRASREEEPTRRQWDPEGVGRNLFDSFGVLGLGLDATEMDVKTAYRMLALQYHPDKNDPERTGMTRDQATAHFQLLNTANSYLRSVL